MARRRPPRSVLLRAGRGRGGMGVWEGGLVSVDEGTRRGGSERGMDAPSPVLRAFRDDARGRRARPPATRASGGAGGGRGERARGGGARRGRRGADGRRAAFGRARARRTSWRAAVARAREAPIAARRDGTARPGGARTRAADMTRRASVGRGVRARRGERVASAGAGGPGRRARSCGEGGGGGDSALITRAAALSRADSRDRSVPDRCRRLRSGVNSRDDWWLPSPRRATRLPRLSRRGRPRASTSRVYPARRPRAPGRRAASRRARCLPRRARAPRPTRPRPRDLVAVATTRRSARARRRR